MPIPVRSLGIRPGSQGIAVPARPNPTTLAAASGSAIVAQPARKSRVGIAAIAGALVLVGGVAWWLGARSHSDDATTVTTTAEPIEKAPKPEATKPVDAPKPVEAPKAVAPEPGVVSLSSIPACDVAVDGTGGRRSPAKVTLPPGPHQVTFTCKALGVIDTIAVDVKSGQTTSLDRDYRRQVQVQRPRVDPPVQKPPAQKPHVDPPPGTGGTSRDGTVNPFAP